MLRNSPWNTHLETTAPVIYYYTALAKSQTNPAVAFHLADFSYFLMRAGEGTVHLTNIIARGAGKGIMDYGQQWVDLISHPERIPGEMIDRCLGPVIFAGTALTKAIDAIQLACTDPEALCQRIEHMASNFILAIQDNPEEAIAMLTRILLQGKVNNALRFQNIQPLVNAVINQKELVNLVTRLRRALDHRIAQITEPVKTALSNAVQRANGVIKTYHERAINKDHIFSRDHRKKGIMKLGSTEDEIISRFKNIVDRADSYGMLENGPNRIKTIINGLEVEIKVHIVDGKVMSLNGYVGHSKRICKNTITLPEQ